MWGIKNEATKASVLGGFIVVNCITPVTISTSNIRHLNSSVSLTGFYWSLSLHLQYKIQSRYVDKCQLKCFKKWEWMHTVQKWLPRRPSPSVSINYSTYHSSPDIHSFFTSTSTGHVLQTTWPWNAHELNSLCWVQCFLILSIELLLIRICFVKLTPFKLKLN